jgi:hypothetical protein
MRAYWNTCAGKRNFGDVLTPYLFREIGGVELDWAPADCADLFAAGSILGLVPNGFTGIILGSGCMYARQRPDLRKAVVMALRGPRTRIRCRGKHPYALIADFGLALREIVPEPTHDLALGEVPHYAAYGDGATAEHDPDILIDLTADVETVIAQASRCAKIISSSLHGLVLADVLGIPSMWKYDARVEGGGFKFEDYGMALGEKLVPGEWRMADQNLVSDLGSEMASLIRRVAEEVC